MSPKMDRSVFWPRSYQGYYGRGCWRIPVRIRLDTAVQASHAGRDVICMPLFLGKRRRDKRKEILLHLRYVSLCPQQSVYVDHLTRSPPPCSTADESQPNAWKAACIECADESDMSHAHVLLPPPKHEVSMAPVASLLVGCMAVRAQPFPEGWSAGCAGRRRVVYLCSSTSILDPEF